MWVQFGALTVLAVGVQAISLADDFLMVIYCFFAHIYR